MISENLSVRKLNELLVGVKLLAAPGRPELGSGREPVLFASFIRPIEKLASFDFSFDTDTVEQLSDEQLEALESLKAKLEKLIELRAQVKK